MTFSETFDDVSMQSQHWFLVPIHFNIYSVDIGYIKQIYIFLGTRLPKPKIILYWCALEILIGDGHHHQNFYNLDTSIGAQMLLIEWFIEGQLRGNKNVLTSQYEATFSFSLFGQLIDYRKFYYFSWIQKQKKK